jgi:hypothetical protein
MDACLSQNCYVQILFKSHNIRSNDSSRQFVKNSPLEILGINIK